MKTLLILLAVLVVLIAVPLMTIWSINTLFGLGIVYNTSTWAASWWLGFIFGGGWYMATKKS